MSFLSDSDHEKSKNDIDDNRDQFSLSDLVPREKYINLLQKEKNSWFGQKRDYFRALGDLQAHHGRPLAAEADYYRALGTFLPGLEKLYQAKLLMFNYRKDQINEDEHLCDYLDPNWVSLPIFIKTLTETLAPHLFEEERQILVEAKDHIAHIHDSINMGLWRLTNILNLIHQGNHGYIIMEDFEVNLTKFIKNLTIDKKNRSVELQPDIATIGKSLFTFFCRAAAVERSDIWRQLCGIYFENDGSAGADDEPGQKKSNDFFNEVEDWVKAQNLLLENTDLADSKPAIPEAREIKKIFDAQKGTFIKLMAFAEQAKKKRSENWNQSKPGDQSSPKSSFMEPESSAILIKDALDLIFAFLFVYKKKSDKTYFPKNAYDFISKGLKIWNEIYECGNDQKKTTDKAETPELKELGAQNKTRPAEDGLNNNIVYSQGELMQQVLHLANSMRQGLVLPFQQNLLFIDPPELGDYYASHYNGIEEIKEDIDSDDGLKGISLMAWTTLTFIGQALAPPRGLPIKNIYEVRGDLTQAHDRFKRLGQDLKQLYVKLQFDISAKPEKNKYSRLSEAKLTELQHLIIYAEKNTDRLGKAKKIIGALLRNRPPAYETFEIKKLGIKGLTSESMSNEAAKLSKYVELSDHKKNRKSPQIRLISQALEDEFRWAELLYIVGCTNVNSGQLNRARAKFQQAHNRYKFLKWIYSKLRQEIPAKTNQFHTRFNDCNLGHARTHAALLRIACIRQDNKEIKRQFKLADEHFQTIIEGESKGILYFLQHFFELGSAAEDKAAWPDNSVIRPSENEWKLAKHYLNFQLRKWKFLSFGEIKDDKKTLADKNALMKRLIAVMQLIIEALVPELFLKKKNTGEIDFTTELHLNLLGNRVAGTNIDQFLDKLKKHVWKVISSRKSGGISSSTAASEANPPLTAAHKADLLVWAADVLECLASLSYDLHLVEPMTDDPSKSIVQLYHEKAAQLYQMALAKYDGIKFKRADKEDERHNQTQAYMAGIKLTKNRYRQAKWLLWQNQLAKAKAEFMKVNRLAESLGFILMLSKSHRRIADICQIEGQHDDARKNYQLALKWANAQGDRLGEAKALGSLARQERIDHPADLSLTIKMYDLAQRIYREAGDTRRETETWLHLSAVYLPRDLAVSETYLLLALAGCYKCDNTENNTESSDSTKFFPTVSTIFYRLGQTRAKLYQKTNEDKHRTQSIHMFLWSYHISQKECSLPADAQSETLSTTERMFYPHRLICRRNLADFLVQKAVEKADVDFFSKSFEMYQSDILNRSQKILGEEYKSNDFLDIIKSIANERNLGSKDITLSNTMENYLEVWRKEGKDSKGPFYNWLRSIIIEAGQVQVSHKEPLAGFYEENKSLTKLEEVRGTGKLENSDTIAYLFNGILDFYRNNLLDKYIKIRNLRGQVFTLLSMATLHYYRIRINIRQILDPGSKFPPGYGSTQPLSADVFRKSRRYLDDARNLAASFQDRELRVRICDLSAKLEFLSGRFDKGLEELRGEAQNPTVNLKLNPQILNSVLYDDLQLDEELQKKLAWGWFNAY